MINLQVLFLLFLIYSVIGWIIESALKSFQFKRFINRGFLIGPYLPIYGSGAILITILFNSFSNNIIVFFIIILIICSILEYTTSYLMEKLFKARWWDYSNRILNINGRICICNSIMFGIGGLIVLKLNTIFVQHINKMNTNFLIKLNIVLLLILIVDILISYIIINSFKKVVVVELEDSTNKINRQVKQVLDDKIKQNCDTIIKKLNKFSLEIYFRNNFLSNFFTQH